MGGNWGWLQAAINAKFYRAATTQPASFRRAKKQRPGGWVCHNRLPKPFARTPYFVSMPHFYGIY